MGTYVQAMRKLRVTTPLGEDELLLKGFSGSEGISTLFAYRLQMIAENRTKVAFDAILGQKVTVHLQLPDESETHLNGLCVRLVQAERDSVFTLYEAEIVPDVWKLTRKAQSRIFQRMTVPEILKKVFTGFDVDWQLGGKYEPRDYCVQYRETDFNFASRLMEEEGIYYYFEHSDGSHRMIATDNATDHPRLAGDDRLIYEEVEGGTRDENRVWAWRKEQEIRSGKYVLWDHCFELPHKHLEADATILGSVPVGRETHKLGVTGVDALELYDYPGEYAQRFDGINAGGGEQPAELQKIFRDNQRTVELRMDQETTSAVLIRAKSNVKHMVPGYAFTLQRHFSGDGDYVVTGVWHQASFGADYRSGKEERLTYENDLTCIPAALPYRPRRVTPKPVVQGSQTAVVVGPAGEEIYTDKYGRVKVQFHWDRQGKNDENSSCWLRVGTSWAGRQWGAIRIPRIGHEVIVDFLEGDPDRPIVVGSVYNADMMPPYELPANKTQSGVKSRSSLNGGPKNFNEIRFEDKKGKEEFYQHAERNLTTIVEADETRDVGNDRTTTIGHDCRTTIGNDRKTKVGNDQTGLVGANRRDEIRGDDSEKVGGNQTLEVEGKRATTVGVQEQMTVNGPRWDSVYGDDWRYVDGQLNESAGFASQLVERSKLTEVGGSMTLTARSQVFIGSDTSIVLKVGGSWLEIGNTGITISGPVVEVLGSGITLDAPLVWCGEVLDAATIVTDAIDSLVYVPGVGNLV